MSQTITDDYIGSLQQYAAKEDLNINLIQDWLC